ncbi:sodium-dependent transporter [candidate division CSSED10-310 bacterium]|uniref:Sodium-dependent transporter n=1 Tax=candidate division CSSED10-310 bacterium TaxID=2855610 RepID=A0ABV6Z313_UNCC1
MNDERGTWGSRLGFILAASGSAIGLGNIVFFTANAIKYGGGAFYLPYFIALFVVGMPIMIMEFSLGRFTGRAFPVALRQIGGQRAEMVGWFGILNASIITMYYITILSWVFGCFLGSFKQMWQPAAIEAFNLPAGALSNSMSFFFNMITSLNPLFYVVIVWILNVIIVSKGTKTIEKAVKFFVPLMWLMMIVLIFRGLTLQNGVQGIYLLFTPDFSVMMDINVWKGAFSQIFFTLSLGFGIMTTYASYLPKDADDVNNATTVSFMNCGFEFIAGLAFFSLLFTFSIIPKTSTIAMMFFVVPEGIARFPFGVVFFGALFFLLLLFAGLTSSVSLVEAVISSFIDKFGWNRSKTIVIVSLVGLLGSAAFALPMVIDPGLNSDGTLGFTLLDLFDHWAFGYGLLIAGLLECIFLGWLFDLDTLKSFTNKTGWFKLQNWFSILIKYIIPSIIIFILGASIFDEFKQKLYGSQMTLGDYSYLYILAFVIWLGISTILPYIFSNMKSYSGPRADMQKEVPLLIDT